MQLDGIKRSFQHLMDYGLRDLYIIEWETTFVASLQASLRLQKCLDEKKEIASNISLSYNILRSEVRFTQSGYPDVFMSG